MGKTPGCDSKGRAARCTDGRRNGNSGSFDRHRGNLESGVETRFEPKHPRPSVGDRFGELTVVGLDIGPGGGLHAVQVVCSCGAGPYTAYASNLRTGKSVRCTACGRKRTEKYLKHFWGYADIVPDESHRRRLLNRISACINRCRNPNDSAYANYGGRGISVYPPWVEDRREYLRYLITLEGWDVPRLELDRINVNGNYEPGNLRFISRQENRRNQRTVQDLQREIGHLRARLRHCKCGAAESVHHKD